VLLKVAGPPLVPGARVGWSVPTARVRLSEQGRYRGQVESVVAVSVGRQIAIRFGDALIHGLAGYGDHRSGSLCGFDIDPDSVRIWPLH
jgi:hypothetical protein